MTTMREPDESLEASASKIPQPRSFETKDGVAANQCNHDTVADFLHAGFLHAVWICKWRRSLSPRWETSGRPSVHDEKSRQTGNIPHRFQTPRHARAAPHREQIRAFCRLLETRRGVPPGSQLRHRASRGIRWVHAPTYAHAGAGFEP